MEKIKIRADNYSCNCVKFLISPNTAKVITEYVGLKQQRGEHLHLMKLCNVVTSHEAGNPSDRIQQIMSLPVAATRLDTSMTAASNVEELLVASSSFSQHGFSKGRQSRSGSSSRNMDKRGRSPYKQKQNDSWNKSKNSSYQSSSDVQWVKRKSSSSPGEIMTHLPREETRLKLEVTRLIGVLFNRLVVAGGENCHDHQEGELSRDLDNREGGQYLPGEGVA